MSSGRSSKSNNGGESLGLSSIPASSRKAVQSLKEIVNRPEQEIYITLKECNMDLNDTVSRLLSQEPFHEVKSKREKKKEIKETSELRPRGVSATSVRGGRGGTTRYDGRSGSTQFSDSGALRGKPAYKKENGSANFSTSSTFAHDMPDAYSKRQPTSFSGYVENKPQPAGATDGTTSSSQTSPGYQPAWVGAPGQISMADIVKMGRRKASDLPNSSTDTSHYTGAPDASNHNVNYPILSAPPKAPYSSLVSSQEHAPRDSVSVNETGGLAGQHPNEWDVVERSPARGQSVLDPSASQETYTDPSISSNLHVDETKLHLDSWADGVQETEQEVVVEHVTKSDIESASDRQTQAENSGGASHFDTDSFSTMNHHPPQRDTSENHEGNSGSSQASIPIYSGSSAEDVKIAVSSAAANLHQLSLQEQGGVSTEVKPAVIIPSHLQIPTAECSHLSFGSFGSVANVANANLHSSYASDSLDERRIAVNNTTDHPETRGSEYFEDERLQSTADWNTSPRTSADAGNYDSSIQPEVPRQDAREAIEGHQYNFPTSVPGYTLDNTRQLNAAFLYEQANSQMHNLAPLSSVMQGYSNSLQSNTSAPAVQQARESPEHMYSSFLATQSVPAKYTTTASSINGPSLSMPENAKPGMYSMPHPTAQTLPGTNISPGPALPQHLAVHPYSQPTLPLGHFANMVGYPFLPQSYAYVPPGYQQAYASNSTYHQSPAALHNTGMKYTLPQYKSSNAVSNLPQSASVASPYGGFGGSVNIPGSFPLNPSTNSSSTTMGYDDVTNAQYKENKHFLPLQQNDSSTVWVQGPGSRTVSALPASTYYSLQGQAQQHSGFRQAQQPSQHYGNPSYQNFYHSQAGVSQEHQQQTQNDGTGAQGQPGKQSHQMWQHSY